MTLNTVYLNNNYSGRNKSARIGTTEIRLGNDFAQYNSVKNSVVWPALFDGGFFPIGTTYNGRYLTFRRIYLNPSLSKSARYNLNEIRAYQVPNLL